mmetsp:Transcript_14232/g.34401  ORF Transcript_14232/g.34401 Transcript_14232/m.34401 type:complete len:203 (-) Transcript_14232:387-995(-)
MVVVGGETRHLDRPERDKVREEIAERVSRVCDEGGGVAGHAHRELPAAQQQVHNDAEERHAVCGVVVSEEVVDGRQRRAVLEHGQTPALALRYQRLGLIPYRVEDGEYARSQDEGADVRPGEACQQRGRRRRSALEHGGEERYQGREEDPDRASGREEENLAPPSLGDGSLLLLSDDVVVMGMVVIVGVAVAHVHGEGGHLR